MSHPPDIKRHMADLLLRDPEAWASLSGLMAVLALPLVRGDHGARRVGVDVEVAPGQWKQIDSVSIESDRVTFSWGVNGHRVDYVFLRAEGMPRWRTAPDHGPKRYLIGANQ